MLSAIFCSDPVAGGNLWPADDFPAWPEFFTAFPESPKSVVTTSSGSIESEKTQTVSNSGSVEPDQPVSERKRKRMISNRESARRSRMRKQRHLENQRDEMNRLRIENRELTNRLRFVLYHGHRVRTDNDRLQSEHMFLRLKLLNLSQIMQIRQLQVYNNLMITSDITPSLVV